MRLCPDFPPFSRLKEKHMAKTEKKKEDKSHLARTTNHLTFCGTFFSLSRLDIPQPPNSWRQMKQLTPISRFSHSPRRRKEKSLGTSVDLIWKNNVSETRPETKQLWNFKPFHCLFCRAQIDSSSSSSFFDTLTCPEFPSVDIKRWQSDGDKNQLF